MFRIEVNGKRMLTAYGKEGIALETARWHEKRNGVRQVRVYEIKDVDHPENDECIMHWAKAVVRKRT